MPDFRFSYSWRMVRGLPSSVLLVRMHKQVRGTTHIQDISKPGIYVERRSHAGRCNCSITNSTNTLLAKGSAGACSDEGFICKQGQARAGTAVPGLFEGILGCTQIQDMYSTSSDKPSRGDRECKTKEITRDGQHSWEDHISSLENQQPLARCPFS